MTGESRILVTRFVLRGVKDLYVFLRPWTPFELRRFGHIVVIVCLDSDTIQQMLWAELAGIIAVGTSPRSHPLAFALIRAARGCGTVLHDRDL